MPIFNLFSKRQTALTSEPSDILTYDNLPKEFRVQAVHILRDGFGFHHSPEYTYVESAYKFVHDILVREYGIFKLSQDSRYEDQIASFVLHEKNIERVLDTIELCIKYIDKVIISSMPYLNTTTRKITGKDAIEEINERFKQHAIGYQYEDDRIIKVDSTYIHSEIVKPTLQLLFNSIFKGANEEYLKAHEHYRHGRNKECLAECLKAFESTMKIICTSKGWAFNPNDTSSKLIGVITTNNLIPSYLQSQITALKSILESGIPTIRNRIGGHGQGATLSTADDETTRYTLNLTGSNIIYLIELSKLLEV